MWLFCPIIHLLFTIGFNLSIIWAQDEFKSLKDEMIHGFKTKKVFAAPILKAQRQKGPPGAGPKAIGPQEQ